MKYTILFWRNLYALFLAWIFKAIYIKALQIFRHLCFQIIRYTDLIKDKIANVLWWKVLLQLCLLWVLPRSLLTLYSSKKIENWNTLIKHLRIFKWRTLILSELYNLESEQHLFQIWCFIFLTKKVMSKYCWCVVFGRLWRLTL